MKKSGRRARTRVVVAAAVVGAVLLVAACGEDEQPTVSASSPTATDRPIPGEETSAEETPTTEEPEATTPEPENEGGDASTDPPDEKAPKEPNWNRPLPGPDGEVGTPDDKPSNPDKPGRVVVSVAKDSTNAEPRFDRDVTETYNALSGPTEIVFINRSSGPHSLQIAGPNSGPRIKGTTIFKDGKQTLKLNLKPGDYNLYCSVEGHVTKGMETHLTVVG